MEHIKTLPHPTISLLTVKLFATWEQEHPKHHFELDEDVKLVLKGIDEGNMSSWCVIKIEVSWEDISAYDCIGACSYESFDKFIADNDYYADMVNSATRDLLSTLTKIMGNIEEVVNAIEKTML